MQRVTLASGIELDVVDSGPRDAPALIFLHGFPESHRTWRHQIAHLESEYRCIAPDQRGYRGSSKPQNVAAYTPDRLIGDVFQLADALAIDRFTVIGHDWGGAIAWGAAITGEANGRISRAVIANAPHPIIFQRLLYTDPEQRAASQYMTAFRDPANDALVRATGLIGLLAQEVDWGTSPALEPEIRSAMMADWQDRDAAFAMLNWYRASRMSVPPMEAPFALPDKYTPPPLPRITIPMLVIWALEDQALPPKNLDGLDRHVTDLTIAEVPDCGHFVSWEAPEAVNAALASFLARTSD